MAAFSEGNRRGFVELQQVKEVYDRIIFDEKQTLLHTAVLWFRCEPCLHQHG